MISGLVLKYLNGECFVIRRGYETALPASSKFTLTKPKCACVGGDSKVPLGFVSLTENLMMIGMAVWMLSKL